MESLDYQKDSLLEKYDQGEINTEELLEKWERVVRTHTAISRKQRIIAFIVIGIVATVFAVFVWPTAYRYQVLKWHEMQVIIKINRFTGSTFTFNPRDGWN